MKGQLCFRAAARVRSSSHANTWTRDLQWELQANSVLTELCVLILLHARSWRFGRLHGTAVLMEAAPRQRARYNLHASPHEAEAAARKLAGSRGTGELDRTLERLQFEFERRQHCFRWHGSSPQLPLRSPSPASRFEQHEMIRLRRRTCAWVNSEG